MVNGDCHYYILLISYINRSLRCKFYVSLHYGYVKAVQLIWFSSKPLDC